MIGKFETLLGKEYAFLDENALLGENIRLLVYGGSKAYGTSVEGSDIDIRGIATNTADAILCRKDFEVFTDENTDTVVYSLDKIFNLLSNCNPNTIEMLFVREEDVIYADEIGLEILRNRNIFLSNKCVGTFGGYANQQLYRLQQKTLCSLSEYEFDDHIAKVISGMKDHLSRNYGIDTITVENTENGLVAKMQETVCDAEALNGIIAEITNVIKTYKKNSQRNAKAMAHNKINKHAMHLVRLYDMGIDLLLCGSANTYRERNHNLLMNIRNGKYNTEDGMMTEEFFKIVKCFEDIFNDSKESSVLPDEPNYDMIFELQKRINRSVIFNDDGEYEYEKDMF